ncbi:hypothetical protein ACIBL8_11790 [Streptomyces sp. NPDC050523]|uniref:hypothetical protein n=1 Tax=Streptomyces sp. NPDC050523 TaxID=3365622 RepID=UPI0037ADF483
MDWRKVLPYWGLIALVIAVAGWMTSDIGPIGLTVLFGLSFLWFLFQAPVPCGAPIRKEGQTCRNNARGLLRGCHIEQHKWQRVRSIAVRPGLHRTQHELFPDKKTGLGTLGAIVTLVCTLTTTTLALLGRGGGGG